MEDDDDDGAPRYSTTLKSRFYRVELTEKKLIYIDKQAREEELCRRTGTIEVKGPIGYKSYTVLCLHMYI